MIQYNIYHAQAHMAEFARKSTLDRKCGYVAASDKECRKLIPYRICRANTELKYDAKGEDDPSIPAWDEARERLQEFHAKNLTAQVDKLSVQSAGSET